MVKQKRFIILIVLIFIIEIITGCTSRTEFSSDFHTGTEGLKIGFLENAPPDELDYIKGTQFLIGIGVENKGAEDITKGTIKVTSFKNYIDIKGGTECRFEKELENGVECILPVLKGKSFESAEGDFSPIYLDAEVVSVDSKSLESLETIEIEVEYKYATTASIEICVNDIKEVFNVDKSCEAKSLTLDGQGGPVAVTSVKYSTFEINDKKNLLNMIITFENKGDGESEEIELEEISFSDYSNKLRDDKKITCKVSGEEILEKKIKIKKNKEEGENQMVCNVYLDMGLAYLTPLKIRFSYDYLAKENKNIKIKLISEEELKNRLEEEEQGLIPEEFAPPIGETPEDVKKMIAERLKKKIPYGDFRNFRLSKVSFPYLENPDSEEIKNYIGEILLEIKATRGTKQETRDKIKKCYYKVLQRESSLLQFDENKEEMVIRASNIGQPADGCCVGLAQIYVRKHLKDEGFDVDDPSDAALNRAGQWILYPKENIRKGLTLFIKCIDDKNLLNAIPCYTGGPRNYDNPISSSDCPTLDEEEIWWND